MVLPADTLLVEFRESAGLTPPPQELSNASSRLVDLLDECLRLLQTGWDIPPDIPADRFRPSCPLYRDHRVPIVQYTFDLGFTGDARRLDEAMRRFFTSRDNCTLLIPRPNDDKGWKEFQQRYVKPLTYEAARLQSIIYEVRQLIITTGTKASGGGKPTAGEILRAYSNATGTAAQRKEAVQNLIKQSDYSSFDSAKTAASKQGITIKSLKKKVS